MRFLMFYSPQPRSQVCLDNSKIVYYYAFIYSSENVLFLTSPKLWTATFFSTPSIWHLENFRALLESQNWPWPDRSFWKWSKLFPRDFDENGFLCVCYLRFDWSGWIALIKSEILITTGLAWAVIADKWKAPLDSKKRTATCAGVIFSILSCAGEWTSVILAGKHGSRHHSTTSFNENAIVAGTSYVMLQVLSFCYRERA